MKQLQHSTSGGGRQLILDSVFQMRPFQSKSYATARLREYGILVSTDTRRVLGLALSVC